MYVKGTLLKGINIACVASASVWFRSNERPRRNGIFWFWPREKWNEGLPALLLAPFFAQFSTLVPRYLLRNRTETFTAQANRELKQPRRRPQRRLQKTKGLMIKQHYERASRFLLHFFDVHCTITTWNLLIWRFMEDVDILRRISLHLFEPD